jgi:hypothetical protein
MTFTKGFTIFLSLIHPLHLLPLYSPTPLLEQFQQLSLLHFHTWNISTIFTLLCPFFIPSPLPLVLTPGQDLFYLPVFQFFLFFYDGYTEFDCISIHMCVYIYYILNSFIPSINILPTLDSFLRWFQWVWLFLFTLL